MLRLIKSAIATLILFGLFQTPSTRADHQIRVLGSIEKDGTITVANPKRTMQLQQIRPGASKSARYEPREWLGLGGEEPIHYSFCAAYDCYWIIVRDQPAWLRRIPKEDLKAFDIEADAYWAAIRRIRKKNRTPFSPGYWSTFDWPLNPVVLPPRGVVYPYGGRTSGLGAYTKPAPAAPFAFLPTGSHSGKLFSVGRVWHVKATWDPKKKWWKTRFKDEERTDIFWGDVFAKGDSYYFLNSGTGALSRIPIKADKDGLRKKQTVWAKKDQKIVAAITDTKKDTTYFFGNVDKKKSYVFELSKTPRLRYFTRPIDLDRPALSVIQDLSKRLKRMRKE